MYIFFFITITHTHTHIYIYSLSIIFLSFSRCIYLNKYLTSYLIVYLLKYQSHFYPGIIFSSDSTILEKEFGRLLSSAGARPATPSTTLGWRNKSLSTVAWTLLADSRRR